MITFAQRLLHARLQCGYTQKELAQLCHISQSAIASYESGNRLYSRNLLDLAKALGVEPLWLERGVGKNPIQPRLQDPAKKYHTNWPFQQINQADFSALNDQQQRIVENVLLTLIVNLRKEN